MIFIFIFFFFFSSRRRHTRFDCDWSSDMCSSDLTMDKIGPLCRTVEDCALVFDAIRGADQLDPAAVDAPFRFSAHSPINGKKIGVLRNEFETPSDAEVRKIFADALKGLAELDRK